MELAVLAVVRDESSRLNYFLAQLDRIKKISPFSNLYVSFYENDSADDTPEKIRSWLLDNPGQLQSEMLGFERLRGREVTRTQRMADARNRALDPLLMRHHQFSHLLIIDVDVQYVAEDVVKLLGHLERYSYAVMVCASALQNVPDVFGESAWSYYDSWALRDLDGRAAITYARNPFVRCRDRWRWMSCLPVTVQSAFGGLALLPMSIVASGGLHWSGDDGCEHWSFCAAAQKFGSVLACPDVLPKIIHSPPLPQWSAAYGERIRQSIQC